MTEISTSSSEQTNTSAQSNIARTSGLKGRDYLGYALGDTACCLVFGLVTSLLQKFYTDIFQLNPLWIMIMLIGARIWDAVNDPIMGRVADTIKVSKYGRYRPWLIWAAAPLTISAILMFAKWPGLGETPDHVGTFVYAILTYILFGMCYTVLQIPYGSLASVVTSDEKERNKLSIFRSIGAGIGSMPVIIIASFCYIDRISPDGNPVIGENGKVIQDMNYLPVIIGVIVLALASFVLLFVAFKNNKERVVTNPNKAIKGDSSKAIKTLFKSKAFIAISCASMLLLAAQMFTQSYYLYLFNDFFGKNWMNIVSVISTYAPMILLMFFTPKMIRIFGKKEISAVGLAIAAIANLAMYFSKGLMPDSWWLFLLLCFLSGCGQTFILLQVWSFATDAIDEIEVKTGTFNAGTAYAVFMFFRKLGQMISAIAVNGALLAMSYKTYKGAVQTATTLSTMYDMATIIPAVLFGATALIMFLWYPLNKKKTAELQIAKEAMLAKANSQTQNSQI